MLAAGATRRRYALSFTTGALLVKEATILAPLHAEHAEWEAVRDRAVAQNLLQARTYRAGVRLTREVVKRLSSLSAEEIELLELGTTSERAHLMWAAACRRYDLIGEFAEDVVRDHFLKRAPMVTYGDFDSFVLTKSLWHDELTEIKESTLQKLRSNVFKMMQEAGLLSKDQVVVPVLLSHRVATLLDIRKPSDLRYFPTAQGERQDRSW